MDVKWHAKTAKRLATYPRFWDDQMARNASATYLSVFCSPENLVLDINGEGVLAFYRTTTGARALLYGVSWGKGAAHIPTARRKACELALTLLKVQRIEAVIREDNERARASVEDAGARFCGRLPDGLCYNGKPVHGVWYELDRELDCGLPPL